MENQKVNLGRIVTIQPKKEKVNRSKSEKIIIWTVFAILVMYSISLIYPFIYLLFNSMKTVTEFTIDPLGLPGGIEAAIDNYSFVFGEYDIFSMFWYSVILSIGQTAVGMTLSCVAAYILAKYTFKGNAFIYMATIVASLVPTVGAAPATYKLMMDLGFLSNGFFYNYLGMMFMVGAFGGPFLYLHSFFKAIPWSYGESAMIDGASDLRIFIQIMLPLASNGVLTFTVIRFLGCWNEYWSAYLYFGDYETLAVGLNRIAKTNLYGEVKQFAAMIVSIVPVLIFYAVFQKQLMRNTIGGGLKG